jgi:cullin-associated NEDD8-dissociated protein 1
MLSYFCKTVSPMLISRFSEREESVRLDVWATYRRFLLVTGVLTGTLDPQRVASGANVLAPSTPSANTPRQTREDTPNTLKRKRGETSRVATPTIEETPIAILRSQSNGIAKAILKQLSQKSITVAQSAFSLLDALVSVLHGGLEEHVPALASRIQASLNLSSTSSNLDSSSGTATSLKIIVLNFLAHLFDTHPLSAFGSSLPANLIPALSKSTEDKYNKIASSAFAATSSLIKNTRPLSASDDAMAPVDTQAAQALLPLLKSTTKLLEATSADQEVRESAVATLGDFLFYVGDALGGKTGAALALLKDAIKKETTRVCAVRTVARAATSPVMRSAEFSTWIQEILQDVASFLRQNNRVLKSDAFAALPVLVSVAGASLDPATIEYIFEAVAPFVSTDDLPLLPSALLAVNAVIAAKPAEAQASKAFQRSIMPAILNVVKTSSIHPGTGLDALLTFFATLVQGGTDAQSLVDTLKKSTTRVAPRCIGAVVSADPSIVDKVAADLLKNASSSKSSIPSIVFALFTLGEIGRVPCVTFHVL